MQCWLAAAVTVLFCAGQRHHRGGEAHGAAHGRDVAPGPGRQRQQARPDPVRQGHRQGVRRGHAARQGGGQAVHRQAHQDKPPAGNEGLAVPPMLLSLCPSQWGWAQNLCQEIMGTFPWLGKFCQGLCF